MYRLCFFLLLLLIQMQVSWKGLQWVSGVSAGYAVTARDRRCAELLAFNENVQEAIDLLRTEGRWLDENKVAVISREWVRFYADCELRRSKFVLTEQRRQHRCPNWWVKRAGEKR